MGRCVLYRRPEALRLMVRYARLFVDSFNEAQLQALQNEDEPVNVLFNDFYLMAEYVRATVQAIAETNHKRVKGRGSLFATWMNTTKGHHGAGRDSGNDRTKTRSRSRTISRILSSSPHRDDER